MLLWSLALGLRVERWVSGEARVVSDVVARVFSLGHMAVVAGCVVLLLLARAVLVRRAQRGRVAKQLVPADDMDASREDVLLYALALDGTRQRLLAQFLRPAAAVRVTLGQTRGDLSYGVSVPRAGLPVLRSAVYAKVDLAEPGTLGVASSRGAVVASGGDASEAGSVGERLGDLGRNDAEDDPGWREEEALL